MEKNFLRLKYSIIVLAGLFLTTSVLGCNMLRGAGEDISNAGGSIQRTVDRND